MSLETTIFSDDKFMLLIRKGLIERSKIGLYKAAIKKMSKNQVLTSKETLLLTDLVVKLASFSISDPTVYSKARNMATEDNIDEKTLHKPDLVTRSIDAIKVAANKKNYKAAVAHYKKHGDALTAAQVHNVDAKTMKRMAEEEYGEETYALAEAIIEEEQKGREPYIGRHADRDTASKAWHKSVKDRAKWDKMANDHVRSMAVEIMKKKNQRHEESEVDEEEVDEACWKNYKQVGMKKKGGKTVPNCVPEDIAATQTAEEDELEERTNDRYDDVERVRIHKRQQEKKINRKPALSFRDKDDPSLKAAKNKQQRLKNMGKDKMDIPDAKMESVSEAAETSSTADLAEAMKDLLADSFNLYFQTQACHWNVKGKNFSELHAFFGTLYSEVYAAVDVTAEQIRTLDEDAVSSLKEIMERALSEDNVPQNSSAMIQHIGELNDDVIASLYNVVEEAEAANNRGILNFVEGRIDAHEKHGWMLRSYMDSSIKESFEQDKTAIAEGYAGYISKTILK